jgi:hypothetical protein
MAISNEHTKLLEIGEAIIEGKAVDLTCPYCRSSKLVFSFTVGRPSRYGLFIVCRDCGKGQHFNMGLRPPGFREELVLDEFQRLEDEAVRFADSFDM